jgi:hypothetical protein
MRVLRLLCVNLGTFRFLGYESKSALTLSDYN